MKVKVNNRNAEFLPITVSLTVENRQELEALKSLWDVLSSSGNGYLIKSGVSELVRELSNSVKDIE